MGSINGSGRQQLPSRAKIRKASNSVTISRPNNRTKMDDSSMTMHSIFVAIGLVGLVFIFIFSPNILVVNDIKARMFNKPSDHPNAILSASIDSFSPHSRSDIPSSTAHETPITSFDNKETIGTEVTDDNQSPPERDSKQEIAHLLKKKPSGSFDMHFIHIPKCGGTSMTAILRQIACEVDKDRNADCCLNPGFCDYHENRRCASIRGCINHIPQRPWIFKPPPSITIMREPVSRLLSAWFYRGHTPNNDFFQVRPYFKDIRDGKLPKVQFAEYIEMIEYQNIQCRMLGADSFPYRNVTVDKQVFRSAKEAINNMYFVGLQEAYDISVKLLLRELGLGNLSISVMKERDQSNGGVAKRKQELKDNAALMLRTKEVNLFDVKLYNYGKHRFCRTLRKYSDILQEFEDNPKTKSLCASGSSKL